MAEYRWTASRNVMSFKMTSHCVRVLDQSEQCGHEFPYRYLSKYLVHRRTYSSTAVSFLRTNILTECSYWWRTLGYDVTQDVVQGDVIFLFRVLDQSEDCRHEIHSRPRFVYTMLTSSTQEVYMVQR